MKCPVDGATLNMTERNGVEIDFCPTCRGVWLDRGELDKIIAAAAPAPVAQPEPRRDAPRGDYRDARPETRPWRGDDDDDDHRYGKRKRRDSFLSDLFDF
jgi:hypothetical protein